MFLRKMNHQNTTPGERDRETAVTSTASTLCFSYPHKSNIKDSSKVKKKKIIASTQKLNKYYGTLQNKHKSL